MTRDSSLSRRTLPVLLLALVASGCFRYVPAQLETIPPGEGVRVVITAEGATELSAVTHVVGAVPSVRGTVVEHDGADLLIQVPVAQRQDGFVAATINQTVRVPVGEILSTERREFDKFATGLLIGGSVALVASVVGFIVKPFGREEPGNTDPPDDFQMRFSIFSIPIGE